jgi:hypothetical protein
MADEYIAEWPTYDLEVRGIIIEDWPSHNDMMADLDEYAWTHELTSELTAKHRLLLDLIASKHEQMSAMGFRLWPLATPRVHGRARRVA